MDRAEKILELPLYVGIIKAYLTGLLYLNVALKRQLGMLPNLYQAGLYMFYR